MDNLKNYIKKEIRKHLNEIVVGNPNKYELFRDGVGTYIDFKGLKRAYVNDNVDEIVINFINIEDKDFETDAAKYMEYFNKRHINFEVEENSYLISIRIPYPQKNFNLVKR